MPDIQPAHLIMPELEQQQQNQPAQNEDHFDELVPLPSYVRAFREDPNASANLAVSPRQDDESPHKSIHNYHNRESNPAQSMKHSFIKFPLGVDRVAAHLELHEEHTNNFFDAEERRFINLALLSNLAVQLRDKVPRGTHVRGNIPYPRAFTGKDIVSTLHSTISREWARDHDTPLLDRRLALLAARSLQMQLFFTEVEWGSLVLNDSVEDIYMLLDDPEDSSTDVPIERTELPSGILTALTKCYAAGCEEGKHLDITRWHVNKPCETPLLSSPFDARKVKTSHTANKLLATCLI